MLIEGMLDRDVDTGGPPTAAVAAATAATDTAVPSKGGNMRGGSAHCPFSAGAMCPTKMRSSFYLQINKVKISNDQRFRRRSLE